MRIILINVKIGYDCVEPLGILYIGTYLKEMGGHEVYLTDIFYGEIDYVDKIKKFNPDLIGFSVSTPSYIYFKKILKNLKKEFPNSKFCAGGVHPTNMPEECLKENPDLDFIVMGEGEITLQQCIERNFNFENLKGIAYRRKGRIIITLPEFIKNLDVLPIPDRSLLDDFEWYLSPPSNIRGRVYNKIVRIIAGRGCPYNCIFCSSHSVFGKKTRYRTVNNVIDELKYLYQTYKIRGFYFTDDTFSVDKYWVINFCNALIDTKLKFKWAAQLRVDTIDKKMLEMMKKSGCVQVDMGVESGSDKILKNLKKGITVKQVEKAFKLVKEAGIRPMASFIVGNPEETREDIKKTLQLAKKINSAFSLFCVLTPYPGSQLFEMAKKNGWFIYDKNYYKKDLSPKILEEPVMTINFDKKELLGIQAMLDRKFFIRNYLLYFVEFLKYPDYTLKVLKSFFRNIPNNYNRLFNYLISGKFKLFLELIYENFNKDLIEDVRDKHVLTNISENTNGKL